MLARGNQREIVAQFTTKQTSLGLFPREVVAGAGGRVGLGWGWGGAGVGRGWSGAGFVSAQFFLRTEGLQLESGAKTNAQLPMLERIRGAFDSVWLAEAVFLCFCQGEPSPLGFVSKLGSSQNECFLLVPF